MNDSKCKYDQCNCQRYNEKDDVKNECLHCNHFIGHHEIPFSEVDLEEHPFGKCKECSICQLYKEKEGLPNKCLYCDHSQGFHLSWTSTGNSENSGRNAGRPEAETVELTIVCSDKVLPDTIPKYESSSWHKLRKKKLIKKVTIPKSINNILEKIREELKLDQGLKLYSAKKGKLSEVKDVSNKKIFISNYKLLFIKFKKKN
jgi:hypothetical protein